MINVCILIGEWSERSKTPFTKDNMFQSSYEYFSTLALKNGVELFRVSYQWYDEKRHLFTYAWVYRRGEWLQVQNIVPDLVYDKSPGYSLLTIPYLKQQVLLNHPFVNMQDFNLFVDNKLYTYLVLGENMKPHYTVRSIEELKTIITKIPTQKIVLKPLLGSKGDNISIVDRNDLSQISIAQPMIVQEFIDSSQGIPGIVDGVHDLRLVFVNTAFIYSLVRMPAPGSLLANLDKGGTMNMVSKKQIPDQIWPIIDYVQDRLEHFTPKIFSIDFMFDEDQQPWIVELNCKPGILFYEDQRKWQDKFYLAMLDLFKQYVTECHQSV